MLGFGWIEERIRIERRDGITHYKGEEKLGVTGFWFTVGFSS